MTRKIVLILLIAPLLIRAEMQVPDRQPQIQIPEETPDSTKRAQVLKSYATKTEDSLRSCSRLDREFFDGAHAVQIAAEFLDCPTAAFLTQTFQTIVRQFPDVIRTTSPILFRFRLGEYPRLAKVNSSLGTEGGSG